MRKLSVLVVTLTFAVSLVVLSSSAPPEPVESKWYKGNTHTHTLWSDGDSTPEAEADWYKPKSLALGFATLRIRN